MEPVHLSSDVASQPVIGSIHLKPSKLTRTLVSSLVITMSTFEHAGQRTARGGIPTTCRSEPRTQSAFSGTLGSLSL